MNEIKYLNLYQKFKDQEHCAQTIKKKETSDIEGTKTKIMKLLGIKIIK